MRHLHQGPLRIQKALYPEGPDPCHAIIVHPPGGIAGGDHLEIALTVQSAAAAVITTPGAAKWYGSSNIEAAQSIELNVYGDLEWLPQEAIIFDQSLGNSLIKVNLAPESRMIGWDGIVFGRTASGETFSTGRFSQSICLSFEGQLEWEERLSLSGADPAQDSIVGLSGSPAVNTVWAVLREGDLWAEEEQNEIRRQCPELAWTALCPRLLVGRQRGASRALQQARLKAWTILRPRVMNRPALSLRIWAT
ncbi:MAG: urease accessory protein UreD [Burkholderiaceae bacterium]